MKDKLDLMEYSLDELLTEAFGFPHHARGMEPSDIPSDTEEDNSEDDGKRAFVIKEIRRFLETDDPALATQRQVLEQFLLDMTKEMNELDPRDPATASQREAVAKLLQDIQNEMGLEREEDPLISCGRQVVYKYTHDPEKPVTPEVVEVVERERTSEATNRRTTAALSSAEAFPKEAVEAIRQESAGGEPVKKPESSKEKDKKRLLEDRAEDERIQMHDWVQYSRKLDKEVDTLVYFTTDTATEAWAGMERFKGLSDKVKDWEDHRRYALLASADQLNYSMKILPLIETACHEAQRSLDQHKLLKVGFQDAIRTLHALLERSFDPIQNKLGLYGTHNIPFLIRDLYRGVKAQLAKIVYLEKNTPADRLNLRYPIMVRPQNPDRLKMKIYNKFKKYAFARTMGDNTFPKKYVPLPTNLIPCGICLREQREQYLRDLELKTDTLRSLDDIRHEIRMEMYTGEGRQFLHPESQCPRASFKSQYEVTVLLADAKKKKKAKKKAKY